MRASNEHIPIVGVPRAGGRPGYPSHPSEAARCASTEDHQAPSPPLFCQQEGHLATPRPFQAWLVLFQRAHYEMHGSDCVLSLYQLYDKARASAAAMRGTNEAPRSSLLRRSSHFGYEGLKLRGILRNSQKPLPSFAKATEGSPRLHPRSELRGIRRRRINNPDARFSVCAIIQQ